MFTMSMSGASAQEYQSLENRLILVDLMKTQPTKVDHIQFLGIPFTRVHFDIRQDRIILASNLALGGTAALMAIRGSDLSMRNPLEISPDKMRHFFAGYAVGSFSNIGLQILIPEDINHRGLWVFLGGLGSAALVGTLKEVWDFHGGGNPETRDILATALGGVLGTISVVINVRLALRPEVSGGIR